MDRKGAVGNWNPQPWAGTDQETEQHGERGNPQQAGKETDPEIGSGLRQRLCSAARSAVACSVAACAGGRLGAEATATERAEHDVDNRSTPGKVRAF
jgi:hypothetical protein